MRRKPFHQIIADILSLATKPVTKAHCFYSLRVNYRQLNRYLPLLLKTNLLELSSKKYVITDKGRATSSTSKKSTGFWRQHKIENRMERMRNLRLHFGE